MWVSGSMGVAHFLHMKPTTAYRSSHGQVSIDILSWIHVTKPPWRLWTADSLTQIPGEHTNRYINGITVATTNSHFWLDLIVHCLNCVNNPFHSIPPYRTLCIAHQRTEPGTRSNAFSKSTKAREIKPNSISSNNMLSQMIAFKMCSITFIACSWSFSPGLTHKWVVSI